MSFGRFFGRTAGRSAVLALAALLSGCGLPPIYSDDVQIVKLAISQGADPNAGGMKITPLTNLVMTGTRDMGGRLLDVPEGIPEQKRVEVARVLLDAGADPNKPWAHMKRMPLHEASANCFPVFVSLLLERGADPELAPYGYTALHSALGCPRVEEGGRIAGMLLDHVERTRGREAMLRYVDRSARGVDGGGFGALSTAVWLNHQGVAAALIARGTDVNARGSAIFDEDWTPLHWAMAMGNLQMIDFLQRAGADPGLRSRKGAVPEQVIGMFLPGNVLPQFLATYVSSAARVAASRDIDALARGMQAYVETAGKLMVYKVASRSPYAVAPPPPGWNGLEEALKTRAALMAKPSAKPVTGKKPVSR